MADPQSTRTSGAPGPEKARFRLGITSVLLPWLAFGILWILTSDWLVQVLFAPARSVHVAQSIKGLVFVGISCLLILFLLRRFVAILRHREISHQRMTEALEEDALRATQRANELAAGMRALVTQTPTALLLMDDQGRILQSSAHARTMLRLPDTGDIMLASRVAEPATLRRSFDVAHLAGSSRTPRLITIGCSALHIRLTLTSLTLPSPSLPHGGASKTLLALLEDETELERYEVLETHIRRLEENEPTQPMTESRLKPLLHELAQHLHAPWAALLVPSPSALGHIKLTTGSPPTEWPGLDSIADPHATDPWCDIRLGADARPLALRLFVPTHAGPALLVLAPAQEMITSPDFACTLVSLGQRLSRCFTRLQLASLAWIQSTALSHVGQGILLTNRNGRILWCNPGFETMTGWDLDAIRGEKVALLNAGMQNSAFYRNLWSTVLSGRTWSGELYNRRRDGSVYLEDQTIHPVRTSHDEVSHFVASKIDLTPIREREEQIRQLERADFLTGLLNRKGFEEAVRVVHDQLATHPGTPFLLLLDLDAFLAVNQQHGSATGDAVLREVATTLRRAAFPDGTAARLEADTFAVLLPDGGDALDDIAQTYLQRVASMRIDAGKEPIRLTASIGAVPLNPALPVSQTLALAESAMLAASAQGGHRVIVMKDENDRPRHALEAATWRPILEAALADHRLRLVLQDVVHLKSGRTHHYEVLLRLHDVDGEPISPGQFFPIAERLGMAPRLDRWVVESTLLLLDRQAELHVFVNLSGRTLGSEEDLEALTALLMQHPTLLHRITFEVTETAAIREIGAATRWMQELRRHGVRFALDDFGVGSSNFGYLRLLPIDFLKIDGSFVQGIEHDVSQAQIVAAIVGIARALDLEVIAEHVEDARTREKLQSLSVDYGQGWYFQKPRSADEIHKVSLYDGTRTA